MTLNQFVLLDELKQAEVLTNAVKLAERIEGELKYELYEYSSFVIETTSTSERNISSLKPCEDLAILDPYLASMNLYDFQG
jgi:hypothetical protein